LKLLAKQAHVCVPEQNIPFNRRYTDSDKRAFARRFFPMSQTFWEPGVEEQAQPETQPETPSGTPSQELSAEPEALTVSVDDFSALEERILRAVELVKSERQARTAAEQRAQQAESQLHEQAPHMDQLQKELHALKTERDHVRQRVERLLAQLDALEL
jgi:hypothetical protein